MKKFLTVFTCMVIALGVVNMNNVALAGPTPTPPPPAPASPASSTDKTLKKMESFNVKNYLTTSGQEKQPFDIGAYIVRLINFLSTVIGTFAFLAIVVGGIMMVASGGQEQPIQHGKDIIKYSIIGLAVAFSAFYITSYVQSIFYEYGK